MGNIVCFTGHRSLGGLYPDSKAPIWNKIKSAIEDKLKELKPTVCYSGMALGTDQVAAQICIEKEIPFIAAVPHDGQESVWPRKSQEEYKAILEKAKEVIVVNPGPYQKWKMNSRNSYMINRSDVVIAVFDGSDGGTRHSIDYANQLGKTVYLIRPQEL